MGCRRLAENSLVLCWVLPGRIVLVLFWTKYAGPRQINPGILKLTTSRGRRNLCTVFIFVSCEEKGCYFIISLGHQNFDCQSYCGLSRRMQGCTWLIHWLTVSQVLFRFGWVSIKCWMSINQLTIIIIVIIIIIIIITRSALNKYPSDIWPTLNWC